MNKSSGTGRNEANLSIHWVLQVWITEAYAEDYRVVVWDENSHERGAIGAYASKDDEGLKVLASQNTFPFDFYSLLEFPSSSIPEIYLGPHEGGVRKYQCGHVRKWRELVPY